MIEIKNFSKEYEKGKKAVDNISLTIDDGEIFAFIGHNGAGKTTTLKAIAGILDFTDGEILINGKSIKTDPINAKMDMAFVPDNPDLYENMKAIKYINFICDMYNIDSQTRSENVEKYSKLFDMYDHLNEEISSFSHGMKQKIALIAALCHNPKVLILDEPFVGLDPKAVFDMKELMHKMVEDKKCVFFSTHILEVAEKLCTRVAIIKKGKLVKVGSMEEVKGDESLEEVFLEITNNKDNKKEDQEDK